VWVGSYYYYLIKIHYNFYNVQNGTLSSYNKLHTVIQKSSSHLISSETAIESLLSQYSVELAVFISLQIDNLSIFINVTGFWKITHMDANNTVNI